MHAFPKPVGSALIGASNASVDHPCVPGMMCQSTSIRWMFMLAGFLLPVPFTTVSAFLSMEKELADLLWLAAGAWAAVFSLAFAPQLTGLRSRSRRLRSPIGPSPTMA